MHRPHNNGSEHLGARVLKRIGAPSLEPLSCFIVIPEHVVQQSVPRTKIPRDRFTAPTCPLVPLAARCDWRLARGISDTLQLESLLPLHPPIGEWSLLGLRPLGRHLRVDVVPVAEGVVDEVGRLHLLARVADQHEAGVHDVGHLRVHLPERFGFLEGLCLGEDFLEGLGSVTYKIVIESLLGSIVSGRERCNLRDCSTSGEFC